MKIKRIRETHLWINAMVEVFCCDCDKAYQDDNGRQPEDLDAFLREVAEDATADGWRIIDGRSYCPVCVKAMRAEQSQAVASKGADGE